MIRILLVDDQETVRDAIAGALRSHADFDVIGSASSGAAALELAVELQPQVLVIETKLADGSGIDAGRQIMQRLPEVRVLALSACEDEQVVCHAMAARFCGYVLKKSPFNQFIEAIRAVSNGQMFLSPQVVGAVVASRAGESGNGHATISGRERQVLQLVAHGFSTKQIADQLSISLKTVETHRRRVMSKLKLFSIAQLTKYAIREGLTTV